MAEKTAYVVRALAQALLADSDTSLLDARCFLAEILQCPVAEIFHTVYLSSASMQRFERMCQRRQQGEPVAYIVGKAAFWDVDLLISSDVLVPRPDTECLVASVLERHGHASAKCLEFGVGSGAITLALAQSRPAWRIQGIDQSAAAIQCAKANQQRYALDEQRVCFYRDSWWALQSPVAQEQYDIIVANPPYIARDSVDIADNVRQFEPHEALFADDHGLADLKRIIAISCDLLNLGGWLYLEHGFDQAVAVRDLLHAAQYSAVVHLQDYAGHDRVTYAQWQGGCS